MSIRDPSDDCLILDMDEYIGWYTLSGLRVAFGHIDVSQEHGYIPVSYTHLDVYKRQT